jgi:hypothetical protein
MNNKTISEMQNCKTLGELLNVINKNYKIETTTISPIVKGTIISGLAMAVKMTNCKER